MENARFADTVSERIAHRTTPWNKGKLTGARCGRGDERRRRRASGGPSGRLSNPLPPRLDDFRLAFMFGQVARAGAVRWNAEQFARLRPLDDLWYAGAATKLREERRKRSGRAVVEPRMLAFLAHLAAIGLLTMKGLVEQLDDPLVFSDEQLIEGFARVFEAAASA